MRVFPHDEGHVTEWYIVDVECASNIRHIFK